MDVFLEDVKEKLDTYYKATKGDKYSWKDWLNAAIYKVFKVKLFKNDKEGFICSEYVNNFFLLYYDIDLCEDTQVETPNDIYKSKILKG